MDYNHLVGTQIVKRTGEKDGAGMMLVVIHQFLQPSGVVAAAIPEGKEILAVYAEDTVRPVLEDGELKVTGMEEYSACAVLIRL